MSICSTTNQYELKCARGKERHRSSGEASQVTLQYESNPHETFVTDDMTTVCVGFGREEATGCTNITRSALSLGQLPVSPLMAEISALNIDADLRPARGHFIHKSLQQSLNTQQFPVPSWGFTQNQLEKTGCPPVSWSCALL